jgi:uncharacterized membrane protein
MKKLEIFSNVLSVFGFIFYAVFQLSKNAFRWPAFIADNNEIITFGSLGLGYALAVVYYFLTKNAKKAKQLLLVALIITAAIFLLYFSAKL